MKAWYCAQVQPFKPIVSFAFGFSDDGSADQKEWKVTQVVEGQQLAHTWSCKGYTGRLEVAFELVGEESETRLRITHRGLETFARDAHFARQRFEWGDDLMGNTLIDFLAN